MAGNQGHNSGSRGKPGWQRSLGQGIYGIRNMFGRKKLSTDIPDITSSLNKVYSKFAEIRQDNVESSTHVENNMYILTEEKPKCETVDKIIQQYCNKNNVSYRDGGLKIVVTGYTSYCVKNVKVEGVKDIFVNLYGGSGSFIDFLVFVQKFPPNSGRGQGVLSQPVMAVEETKTSDSESRDAIFQRATKFATLNHYYPNTETYMLYNSESDIGREPSPTERFGRKLFNSLDVKTIGKNPFEDDTITFATIDEMVAEKNNMRLPYNGVAWTITRFNNDENNEGDIRITAKLTKAEGKSIDHDPAIGFVSSVVYVLRKKFGFCGKIIVDNHNVPKNYFDNNPDNKFTKIMEEHDVELNGVVSNFVDKGDGEDVYWGEPRGEKIASIFLHMNLEASSFQEIFHNHAGGERSYFCTSDGRKIQLPKEMKIPDLVMATPDGVVPKRIYMLEAKVLRDKKQGIKDLKELGGLRKFLKEHYPDYEIVPGLVTFGGKRTGLPVRRSIFHMNEDGTFLVRKNLTNFLPKM